MSEHHFVSSAHSKDKPKTPKKHAKPTTFWGTIPKEQQHLIREQIELIGQDLFDCTDFHRLLAYVLYLQPKQYAGQKWPEDSIDYDRKIWSYIFTIPDLVERAQYLSALDRWTSSGRRAESTFLYANHS